MKITAVRAALGTGLLLLKPKSMETQMSTQVLGQHVGTMPTSSFFPISAIQLVPGGPVDRPPKRLPSFCCPSPLPLSQAKPPSAPASWPQLSLRHLQAAPPQ